MNKTENELIVSFLSELSDRFGDDGCNDYFLPNNEESLVLAKAASYAYDDSFNEELNIDKKGIYTCNTAILDFLIKKIMTENNITKEDLEKHKQP
jgi:hypothetical protein